MARYHVYHWDNASYNAFEEEFSMSVEEALDASLVNVEDYGVKIGEFGTEDDANAAASDVYPEFAAVYDTAEKCWFN